MFSKLLNPTNDVAFKRIFGTERNKDILIHFINDMLVFRNNPIIVDVAFQPTIQDPDIASQKTSIIDVLCKDEAGRQYIVEMQVAKMKGFEKRAQYYAAKAYSSQSKVGTLYENLQEVVFIAIVDYIMFPDKKSIKSDHEILDRDSLTNDLKDFSFTFLELPKFQKSKNDLLNLNNNIEAWCYFFKYAEDINPKELDGILKNAIMGKAVNELVSFNWNDDELYQYESAEKRKNDYQSSMMQKFDEGKIQGKIEGITEEKIKIAKNMLAKGMNVKDIAELTGLTVDEINKM